MCLTLEDLYRVRGTILLMGETGTGKSFLARQIHEHSLLKDRPFITCHLASLHEELIESELFGHKKGAFTGAYKDKLGQLELVGEGTLFLDEIADLSLTAQKKLLWPLEERLFQPVGAIQKRSFKGRIMAATNHNIPKMIKEGRFRQDLWERLKVFCYTIPPLRENPDHLNQMIYYFLHVFKKEWGKKEITLSPQGYEALINYSWPGNVREVRNAMEYSITLAKGPLIQEDHLPPWITEDSSLDTTQDTRHNESSILQLEKLPINYTEALKVFDQYYLGLILKKFNGRINYTAHQLQISKATLIAKAKKYGINTWALRTKSSLVI